MELTFEDKYSRELASNLETCEMLCIYLEMSDSDIKDITRIRLLRRWKQIRGSAATYKAMTITNYIPVAIRNFQMR